MTRRATAPDVREAFTRARQQHNRDAFGPLLAEQPLRAPVRLVPVGGAS